jgi:hypothetical protein
LNPADSNGAGAGFARIVLLGSAAAFAAIGGAFVVAPAAMARHVDVSLAGALADNDVRAVYGGLQLGCAAFLCHCAAARDRFATGLAGQLCLFGGLLLARTISLFAAGSPGALGLALHGAEVTGFALGWAARARLTAATPRPAT